MDGWTDPYPDVDLSDMRPALLDQDGLVMETRTAGAQQAEAARVAQPNQIQTLDCVGNSAEADAPLPFATPLGAAPAL